MFFLLRQSAVLVPALSLLGAYPAGVTTPAPTTPERLVAEAVIQEVGKDQHQVYLPVVLHGHAGTLILHFFQAQVKLLLSSDAMAQAGVASDGTLDSLTIGKTVAHDLPISSISLAETSPAGLPPVIGIAGNEFLDEYDIVVDGPAHRVRLYAPTSRPSMASAGTLGKGLPPGVKAADCVSTQPMPEGHTGFAIQANGKPMTATMQTAAGGLTIINLVAAQSLGLTQHSPNVQRVPDSLQTLAYQGVPNKYVATGIHLTLGRYPFREDSVYILARTPLQPTPATPSIELTFENLLDQVFVQSNSTGQVCLADPHASRR
ncbi:MAG TPA: hypothetical protein VNU46_05270 [Gemmatimonadaceae bacterium]|jgi:hypothetical protein|nr:hypothetical protein [Gemmatimonadaceae bacterium]